MLDPLGTLSLDADVRHFSWQAVPVEQKHRRVGVGLRHGYSVLVWAGVEEVTTCSS